MHGGLNVCLLQNVTGKAVEMAQPLVAVATFAEDLGLVRSSQHGGFQPSEMMLF